MNNPDSYVAAEYLSGANVSWISFSSFEMMYMNLSERMKQSFPGKKIKHEIYKEKNLSIGTKAIPFAAINSKGDTMRLSDRRGKNTFYLTLAPPGVCPVGKPI